MKELDPPPRNAGQSLLAAFRAARARQRLALQAKLRAARDTRRQERLARLSRVSPPEAKNAASTPPPEQQTPDPAAKASIFSQIIGGAQADAPPPHPEPPEAPPAPPLSALGFGPGMVIRFNQLGIETAADLAASDPTALRTALGDITRLVDVDVWIETARQVCEQQA